MKTLIVYSSATGNTKKLAEVILGEVEDAELIAVQDVEVTMLDHFDMIYLGYWVDKGDMDAHALQLAKKLENRKLVLFGTLGAASNTTYYDMVKKRVETHVVDNKIYGHFLCQGKVGEALMERYRKLVKERPDDIHIQAQLENYENGKTHPDEADFDHVRAFVKAIG